MILPKFMWYIFMHCPITTILHFFPENFLHSSFETNNPKLYIPGYILLGSDHPSSSKKGVVPAYYKNYLPVIRLDDISTLVNCIVTEPNLGKISILFAYNNRFPSQSTDEFESYCQNLYLPLTNIDDQSPLRSAVIGNFNAWCIIWSTTVKASKAGKDLDSLTLMVGYAQLINKPAHLFSGGSSCIDLIF